MLLFLFIFFFSFLQTVQTVLHITTKNRGYSLKKMGLIQVLGEQKATTLLMHLGGFRSSYS